jgi:hypothetical protein
MIDEPTSIEGRPSLDRLQACFDGAIPAVLATASAAGVPNITYLSKIHRVDDERVALSNQSCRRPARTWSRTRARA